MGGFPDVETPGQSTIQAYNTKTDDWASVSVAGGAFNRYDRHFSAHASTFSGGGDLSLSVGGQDHVPGMIIFNSSNPQQPSWENVTSDNLPYFWGGVAEYARFGDAGVLIAIGGFLTESTEFQAAQLREMNSIQVYDIAGKKWSTVFTTGDAPVARSSACSAISAAPDDSSFNLVVHGGWDENNVQDDIYVLTMPAFHWIKIEPKSFGGSSTGSDKGKRMQHWCGAYKDRSMIVLGGKDGLDKRANCSDNYPAIRLLDTTTFEWNPEYPLRDNEYKVPQPVIDVIGGSPTGGAKPASEFAQTLGNNVALFSKTIPRYDPDNPPPKRPSGSPSPSSPSASATPDSNSGHSAGTIAGAAIGGVAGVIIIALAAWFFLLPLLRKRRREKRGRDEDGESGEPMNQYQWSKPELSPEPGKEGYYAHEAEGDDPIKLAPNEVDSTERVEAPDGEPNSLHELPAPEHERKSGAGLGVGAGGRGSGRSWSQRARESKGVSAISSGFGSGRSGRSGGTTTSGTGDISSPSAGRGATPPWSPGSYANR